MKTVFVSGHLDLTTQEFNEHYKAQILAAIANGGIFVFADARGADKMSQDLVKRSGGRGVVFHMFDKPRHNAGFGTVSGFSCDERRDCALTCVSDCDLAWVRPGRERSGTAKNLERRQQRVPQGFHPVQKEGEVESAGGIIDELRSLSKRMIACGSAMEQFAPRISDRGREMVGAGNMAAQWAGEWEKECRGLSGAGIMGDEALHDVCCHDLLEQVALQYLKEHQEMKNFTAGFGPRKPCDCHWCNMARGALGLD